MMGREEGGRCGGGGAGHWQRWRLNGGGGNWINGGGGRGIGARRGGGIGGGAVAAHICAAVAAAVSLLPRSSLSSHLRGSHSFLSSNDG